MSLPQTPPERQGQAHRPIKPALGSAQAPVAWTNTLQHCVGTPRYKCHDGHVGRPCASAIPADRPRKVGSGKALGHCAGGSACSADGSCGHSRPAMLPRLQLPTGPPGTPCASHAPPQAHQLGPAIPPPGWGVVWRYTVPSAAAGRHERGQAYVRARLRKTCPKVDGISLCCPMSSRPCNHAMRPLGSCTPCRCQSDARRRAGHRSTASRTKAGSSSRWQ